MRLDSTCWLIALATTLGAGTAVVDRAATEQPPGDRIVSHSALAASFDSDCVALPDDDGDHSDDSDQWPPPGVDPDLDPIYFFETGCPYDLVLVNWTDCMLYFRTYVDCDGDGIVDVVDEHFVDSFDEESGIPWMSHIQPKEDCEILYWGLFDILPWGDCWPDWLQDPYIGPMVHFY